MRETTQALRRARSTPKPTPPMASTAATAPMITQVVVLLPEPESFAAAEVAPAEEPTSFVGLLDEALAEELGVAEVPSPFSTASGSTLAGPGLMSLLISTR